MLTAAPPPLRCHADVCACLLSQSYAGWIANMVMLYWYRSLVEKAEGLYLTGAVLYGANHLRRGLDNMDQRIAADCRSMTQYTAALFLAQGGTATDLVSVFATIALSTAAAYNFGFLPLGACYVWTIGAMIITGVLMRPVVPATYVAAAFVATGRQAVTPVYRVRRTTCRYNKNVKEGDFRFAAARYERRSGRALRVSGASAPPSRVGRL